MASPLRLQVDAAANPGRVDAAWAAVVDEFEATEVALSRFRETSEAHRLRLAGGSATAPSRRLVAALTLADRARRVTGGRFDPRVVTDLERLGSIPLPIPAEHRIDAEPEARVLRRHGRTGLIEVPRPVDFGGLGKGLALRWAGRRAAAALGGTPFLLEAGGDLIGRAAAADDRWWIGIEDPGGDGGSPDPRGKTPLAVVALDDRLPAIATSSIRLARWPGPDGRAVHHLIDPATGEPGGGGLRAVTVGGPDPAWAEIWSKSLFLVGPAAIGSVGRSRGLAAWWVMPNGSLEMTPAARRSTLWVRAENAHVGTCSQGPRG